VRGEIDTGFIEEEYRIDQVAREKEETTAILAAAFAAYRASATGGSFPHGSGAGGGVGHPGGDAGGNTAGPGSRIPARSRSTWKEIGRPGREGWR
jgi:hypothetical protein